MPKKKSKIRVTEFGLVPLMKADIAAFFEECTDDPKLIEIWKGNSHALLRLALLPHEMKDADTATWFPSFYALYPQFVLAFMLTMQKKYLAKSEAEKMLRSFDGLAQQNQKDAALAFAHNIPQDQLRTARAKIKKTDEPLQKNPKLL